MQEDAADFCVMFNCDWGTHPEGAFPERQFIAGLSARKAKDEMSAYIIRRMGDNAHVPWFELLRVGRKEAVFTHLLIDQGQGVAKGLTRIL